MGNNNNESYKDFERYERELDLNVEIKKTDEDEDFSFPDIDLGQEEPETPMPPEQPVVEEPAPEEPLAEEKEPEPVEVARHKHLPMNGDDMTKLSKKLEDGIVAIVPLRDQAMLMVKDHDDIRLPKGLRTTSQNLCDITDTLEATKALVDLYMELGVEPLYQSVDDSRLKTETNNTINTLLSHIPTMQEGLNDVEAAMNEDYDRPSANLRIRIVKAQTKIVKTNALEQAKALVQTTEAFPLEYGSLRLLCLFHEKGDNERNHAIDHALRLGEAVQVPVADAPAMLQAVQKNDQKAVDAIVNRMIQNS